MDKNPIIDFVEKGGNLMSENGQRLIEESERDTIKRAMSNQDAAQGILAIMNGGGPFAKRKVMMSLGS